MNSLTTKLGLVCMLTAGVAALYPAAAGAASTDADKQFLSTAAQSDMNEIKISQLATEKASNPQVKAFAHKMVADHDRLEASMKPYATAWSITPPAGLDADHQAIYDKLNGLSGSEFDKQYMNAMTEDHHKALDLFTQEASTTTDARFKGAVIKGKAVVASHTKMADSLDAKI